MLQRILLTRFLRILKLEEYQLPIERPKGNHVAFHNFFSVCMRYHIFNGETISMCWPLFATHIWFRGAIALQAQHTHNLHEQNHGNKSICEARCAFNLQKMRTNHGN